MNRREFILGAAAGAGLVAGLPAFMSFDRARLPGGPALPRTEEFSFESVWLDASGKLLALLPGRVLRFSEPVDREVAIDMMILPAVRFSMGACSDESGCTGYERIEHEVRVPRLAMGQTPVTQAQWEAVSRMPQVARSIAARPSHVLASAHPVDCVSWEDAAEFCARLAQSSGRHYRLPSEAEWEGACRAGSDAPFHCGPTITSDYANYIGAHTYSTEPRGTYRRGTTQVSQFRPHAFGLYDMHGNVAEWCADHWHENYRGAPADGRAWLDEVPGSARVVRGGAWSDSPARLRSANRSGYSERALNRTIGFRVAVAV